MFRKKYLMEPEELSDKLPEGPPDLARILKTAILFPYGILILSFPNMQYMSVRFYWLQEKCLENP